MFKIEINAYSAEQFDAVASLFKSYAEIERRATAAQVIFPFKEVRGAMVQAINNAEVGEASASDPDTTAVTAAFAASDVAAAQAQALAQATKKQRAAKPKKEVTFPMYFADGGLEDNFFDLADWASVMGDRMNCVSSVDELLKLNVANSKIVGELSKQLPNSFAALLEIFEAVKSAFETVEKLEEASGEAIADPVDEAPEPTKEEVQSLVKAYCNIHGMKAGVEKLKNEFDVERVSDMPAAVYRRAVATFAVVAE